MSVYAQSENYLKELDDEVSDLNLDSQTEITEDEPGGIRGAASGVPPEHPLDLAPGLSMEDFEKALKRNYMGSYTFYRHLDPEYRRAVYSAYRKDPDPERLRKMIRNALKDQRGE